MVEPLHSNPLRILKALDGFLKTPFELIVYGRSALALGYPDPPSDFLVTMDVDAILPDIPEIQDAFKKNSAWLRSLGIC